MSKSWCYITAKLTESYIEALLVVEEPADSVWQLWTDGEIDDQLVALAWWLLATRPVVR